jgi:U3 small nucleolar RNA-associated protein 18
VDGHTNPSLSTLHLPALPVSRALWHPGGTQLLLAGARPFFHVYDPNTGTTQRSPRGLWGTTSNAAGQDLSLETSAFSPDGARLAIAGRGGRVHVVDFAARAGGAQVVGGVKANRPVRALAWAPNGELMSVGDDAEVCVWDVRMFRCLRRWKDESAFGARVGEVDRSGKYFAIGCVIFRSFLPRFEADAFVSARVLGM